MKKITMMAALLLSANLFAQTIPQGTPPGAGVAAKANAAWYRGGNLAVGTTPPGANIFGTMFNSPIYTYTNGVGRSKLNGSFAYNVNGFAGNREGYLLLGYSQTYAANLFNNLGAFSLLHLNGNEGTFVQDGGYRPWMRTGVSFTDNNDFSYLGIRKVGNGTDITETVLSWSDNSGNGFPGPDDMVFRFTAGGNGNNTISNNLTDVADLDGLHVARFTGNGEFGIGNTFGTGNPLYVRPASLQHLSLSNMRSVYTQYTNRNIAVGSGTGETAADGLRIGILGHNNNQRNGNALIYNQERRHLLFSTNANTNTVNINNGNTRERMRITSINAPTNLAGGGFGINNPGGLNGNITRVAISHNPNSPVTRPLSLLHLGYNTGQVGFTPTSTDGWRNWMDIGTFTSNGTDNMYVGLKAESGGVPANDRYDAVINWGDNSGVNPLNGADNLRFIFTETITGSIPGNLPATSNDGLEVGRFYPGRDTLGTFGRFGVGDFTVQGVNEDPTHKLDVVGNGRFRFLPDSIYQADSLVDKVVMVDSLGVLRWKDASNIGGIGNFCADPQVPISSDYEIALDSANYYFSKQGNSTNAVGIGLPCGTPLLFARLQVHQSSPNPLFNPGISIAGQFNNTAGGILAIGTYGDATGSADQHMGGYFSASGGSNSNFGVYCTAPVIPATPGNPSSNLALFADGDAYVSGIAFISQPAQIVSDQLFKTNVDPIQNALGIINQLQPKTFEYDASFNNRIHFQGGTQYGLIAQEVENVLPDLVMQNTIPAQFDSLGNVTAPAIPYKSLNYNAFIAILMKGIQEQNQDMDSLKNVIAKQDSITTDLEDRLATLEACINNIGICNNNGGGNGNKVSSQSVTLENLTAIVLDQNLPNPFAESTQINFVIPDDVMNAKLLFYDMSGRIINEVNINERGNGTLTVYGENLEQGIYTYSLIADGKLIATKKMVKK